MDGPEVLKKQRPRKVTRRKSTISRSNVLKFIVSCLEMELYSHMLYWADREKNEFIVKFVHMHNPISKTADYLGLFKGLDELSSNYEKYLLDEKYEHKCKVRCKSNLRKLDESGAITYMGRTKQWKSIQLRKYKLNVDVMSSVKNVSKDAKITKGSNDKGLSHCETVTHNNRQIQYYKGKFKTETQPNEQSHYLCLSNTNSASSTASTLFNTSCSTENRNGDTRNVLLKIQPLTVYKHEKQMDGINMVLQCFTKQNLAVSSANCFPIEDNNKWKSMEYNEFFQIKPENMEVEQIKTETYSDETKTETQMVPCSPLSCMDFNDLFEGNEVDEFDVEKTLQQNDPYLSSTMSDSWLEGNEENSYLDFKDFYTFEYLLSSDDG
ncbi:uncharacterized protein LOC129972697 isoform X2 [Argiope bruennichi]|uniref:uncharacterized protein LOC129972697 isoform X2 n=1 Tax=Argiope bruennichi TaxID=94029 RepID=UPI00249476CE|nr:uncharacterized protein LOC129972697 isoform X2 [Argiope bruennichi]